MRNILISALLISLLINATVPLAAQDTGAVTPLFAPTDGPVEAFGRFRGVGDTVFADETRKMSQGSDVAEALEAQSAYFIEQFLEATKGQFEKGVAKSTELNKKLKE